jgi:ankyrin repeat protein
VNVTPDPNKLTALHLCGHHGRLKAAQLLVDRGADVNCRDAAGYTPLISAAANGHYKIVALLLAKGADHAARVALGDQKGANAWDLAHRGRSLGHTNASVLLRRAGADVSADWRPAKQW